MFISLGARHITPFGKYLEVTEILYISYYLLSISEASLSILISYRILHGFIHEYYPCARADNSSGTKF